MEYIITYIITIVSTYLINSYRAKKLIKDIADNGYKINVERCNHFDSSLDCNDIYIEKIITFIPFVNVFTSIYSYIKYNDDKESIFNSLRVCDAIELMDKKESYIYDASPKTSTAIKISLSTKEDIDKLYEEITKIEETNALENLAQTIRRKKIDTAELVFSILDYYNEKYPDKKEAEEHMKNASPKDILNILNDLYSNSDNNEYIYVEEDESDEVIEYIYIDMDEDTKIEKVEYVEYDNNEKVEDEKGFSKVKKR